MKFACEHFEVNLEKEKYYCIFIDSKISGWMNSTEIEILLKTKLSDITFIQTFDNTIIKPGLKFICHSNYSNIYNV